MPLLQRVLGLPSPPFPGGEPPDPSGANLKQFEDGETFLFEDGEQQIWES